MPLVHHADSRISNRTLGLATPSTLSEYFSYSENMISGEAVNHPVTHVVEQPVTTGRCGYGIVVITKACHALNAGSIPASRLHYRGTCDIIRNDLGV